MKYAMLSFMLLALTGCKEASAIEKAGETSDGVVEIVIDTKRGVTCYVYDGYKSGGIFCFTKEQLETK